MMAEEDVISNESLPQLNERSLWIGNLGGKRQKAYFDMDKLTSHAVLVGGTSTGKTIAAMVIAEECLLKNVPVLVFDPTRRWTGFSQPCTDEAMLNCYDKFGLSESDAKGFKTNLVEVDTKNLNIRTNDYAKKGEITVFLVGRLTPNDYNTFMKNSLESLFYSITKQSDRLEMLIVIENAYMLLPQFGGQGALLLERACREFRKWGIGLILPTQIYSEFGSGVTANVATEFLFSTKFEKDIERVGKRYGSSYSSMLSRMKTGQCMVQNVNYNYTKPWRVDIRPTLHQPTEILK
jgi:DNA helicase HerA-like ATPase